MSSLNPILEYYQGIRDGTYVVGEYIRLWYEYLIKGFEEKRFTYSPKHAGKAIRFIETFMHHHEGALAPQLLKLELWQKALVACIFGVLDHEGNRQFREVVVICGRKNGKSLLCSAISEFMAYCDDYGARVYYAAPKLDQAKICFEAFYQAILQEPELSALAKKRRSDVYIASRNATVQPLSFNAKKSDGLNISCAICDEIASWSGDAGIKYYEVIRSSFGARKQALCLSISTAGYETGGIFDELVKRGTRVLKGGSQETRLAPFFYMIDNVNLWDDITELQKANPNLSVSVSVDYLLEEINIARGSLSKKAEFLCKYCNVKQNSSQAWLSTQTVNLCVGEELKLEDFRGCYCVAGVDLSQSIDLTSACVVIEKNDQLYVFSKFWLPAEKIEEATARDGVPYDIYIRRGLLSPSGDNLIDYNDVFNWFKELIEQHEIYPLKVGFDRFSAQYFTQQMTSYGFHMIICYQGENMTPTIREIEGLMKDGVVHIGNNDLLMMHFLDSALKQNRDTNKVKLVKIRPQAHIDGMAAFIDAMGVRSWNAAEIGEQLKNR